MVIALSLCLIAVGPDRSAQAQASFPPDKLQAFVIAARKVDGLVRQWQPRLQAAQSQEEADTLGRQADTEILAAIEKTEGMTVAEYREILGASRADKALSEKIRAIYRAAGGE